MAPQQASDTLAKTSGELGGAGGAAPDIDGGYDVYEAYGEFVVPIARTSRSSSLTSKAGVAIRSTASRAAATTNTTTYKVGGSWEPVDGLKFRGNYAHAVRAPNINELFRPVNTVLTNLTTDPCAGARARPPTPTCAQSASRRARRRNSIGTITNPTAAQANITTGGNLNLKPEEADTYTFGAVFQPSFAPRFSISADYYNIKVKKVIGAPLPGDLIGGVLRCPHAPPALPTRTAPSSGVTRSPVVSTAIRRPPRPVRALTQPGQAVHRRHRPDRQLQQDFGFGGLGRQLHRQLDLQLEVQGHPDRRLNRECVGYYSVELLVHRIAPAGVPVEPAQHLHVRRYRRVAAVAPHRRRWSTSRRTSPTATAPSSALCRRPVPTPVCRAADGQLQTDPVLRHLRPDDALQRRREPDLHASTVQNLLDKEPPIVGNTHRFDHLQQRQHLSVDLRRAGPPLRGRRQPQVLKARHAGQDQTNRGRAAMPAPFRCRICPAAAA